MIKRQRERRLVRAAEERVAQRRRSRSLGRGHKIQQHQHQIQTYHRHRVMFQDRAGLMTRVRPILTLMTLDKRRRSRLLLGQIQTIRDSGSCRLKI